MRKMKSLTPPYYYGGGGRKHSGRGGAPGGRGAGGSRPCSKRKSSELSSSLGPGLPALPNGGQGISGVARYTLQQLIITTEVLVPSTTFSGVGSRGRGRRLHSSQRGGVPMLPMLSAMNGSGEQPNYGVGSSSHSGTPLRDPSAEFRLRMRPLTQPRKYGAVPAPAGDGTSPWDHSQLLQRRRTRIQKAKRFHKRRRAEFAKLVMNSCKKLRATHRPSQPDLANILLSRLPSTLKTKYYRILQDLFQELRQREVRPVRMKPLGTYERYVVPGVDRVPWVGKERRALSRAMASFPPAVRTVMSHALRPLETLTLVDVNDGGGLVSSGEGVELSVLITRWRAASRAGRTHLRSSWFSDSVSAIREAAIATNLSPSRRHAVMHAFNNLLASKLQEVLIRSVESVLKWLGSEEEPWVGPRLKLYLVLENDKVTLQPNESELFSAFMDLFKELDECVQLYRGTWEEPQPPKIPKWRQKAAADGTSEGSGEATPLLRPLEPKRETLVVTLSEPQWEGFRTSLSNSIAQRFKDAAEFISQIMSEWSSVLSGEVKQEVNDFLSEDAELHEYAGKITHYSKYVEQASHVPTSGTLHVFRLEYKFLRQSLLSVSGTFVSVLRNQLIVQHRDTVQGLNTQFETIHSRIQETPVSTEQLFKLMEYVEEVRRISIHRLAEEVAEMVVRLKAILDVVHLTDDDLATTAAVIVWPAKLKPVIERAVESLEDYKQEFEETLLERSGEVNHTLERIQQFVTELEELSDVAHVSKYIREVKKLEGRLEGVSTLVTWVNQEEALFKFPVSSFPLLAELKDCLVPYEELFTLVMKWRKYEKHWMDGDFTSLDPDFIDVETEDLARELFRLRKAFKTKFKQQALDGDPRKARMNLDDPNPDNLPGPLRVCALAMQQIKDFKEHLPLVAVLCNKGLRARHWESLNKAAGFDITPNAGTSLRKVVQMELGGLLKEFEVVSCGASREYSLELSLANMRHAWQTTHLVKAPHPEVEVDILAGLDEARELVEDHLITTHTIKNSPFVGPFVDDVKKWEAVLKRVQEALTLWMKVQTVWVEMTPIFSTPDLPLQLPDENQVFLEVHEKWMAVMEQTVQAEHLLAVVIDADVLASVIECVNNIDILQKAVHTYLDNKRRVFPRLYFLSNEELTALLCEKDVNQLEKHLRKCFNGVHSLHLDDQQSIYAISSIESEVVLLGKKVPTKHARDSIEHWLLEFQGAVTDTLKGKTRSGVEKWTRRGGGGTDVDSLLPSWPLQVTLAVRHIFWTAEVQQAIGGGTQALQECLTRVEAEVRMIMVALRRTTLDSSRHSVSTPHTPVTPTTPPSSGRKTSSRRSSRVSLASTLPSCPTRHSLSTLMLVAVHSREIIKDLIRKGVASEEAFTWLSHLRYYMADGEVEARMLYCPLPWGWEYVGAEGRLVVTPLTTRAHHALVTAYNSHLGGAPEGPAGTGKTETVKDLARSLSMNCLVFNCSDDLDYISMGKFFTGVAADGSWVCFDEFNTLDVGVLSVAAQQILRVVSARREGCHTFTMEGARPLPLNHRGFIAVTMNPKYRGRVALPDNLKLLLRPVSMLVADYHSIAEVSLLSCGFLHARALASRIVNVMSACRNMLHPHYHYDFGMRAVKTVLLATARLRITQVEWSETEVVLRALREVNQPKLVAEDNKRFEDIMGDYFLELPSTPRPPNATLSQYIEKVCAKEGLKVTKDMMAKTLQLYETLRERHGAMVVGPPCSAKSTIIRILATVLSQLESDRPINLEILNPKTMNQAQLIGFLHPGTREWSDGLVTQFIREAHFRRSWLVFDGPTDASWVESFNTALDDSRKLCLPSGETVPIPPDMVMIFEVLDLSQASPATVSRCGMVYVGSETITWHVIMHFWLHHNAKIPEEDKSKTAKPAVNAPNGKPGALGPKMSNAGLKGAGAKGPGPGGRPSNAGPKGTGPGAKGANAAGNGDLPWWDEYGVLLRDLANWLIPPALQFLRDNCRHLLPVNQISLIRPVFPLTATMVDDVLHDESVSQKERGKLGPIWTTAAFLFSLTWSLAGALTKESKEVFNTFYRRLVMGYNKNFPAPDSIEQIGCPYPAEGSVFDVVFDAKQRSFWRPWTDIIKHTEIPETTKIATLLVPTIECTRLEYLIGLCGRSLGKVLVLGEGQSGRRVTMKHHLRNLKSSENETVILPVTPAAVAQDIKSVVLGYTVERESGGFGAKEKRRLAIFVDDLHLAAHDPYNARPVHEALREAMQRKVWIDNDGTTKKPLEDIIWFCGASLSQRGKQKRGGEGKGGKEDEEGDGGGGGSIIEPRCQAEFMAIAAPSIADETISKIFTTQLNVFLRAGGFVPDVFTVVAGIVSGTMEILQHVRKLLPPTPSNAHYTFNLSTAAKVIHSVSFMRKENMETKRHFVRFWVHEIYREFCDRLMAAEQVTGIYDIIIKTIKTNFRDKIHVIFDKICNDDGSVTEACMERVCWGIMGNADIQPKERRYEELNDAALVQQNINVFVQEYNGDNATPLKLVTFRYVVEHVSRACRALCRKGGHLLLVGVGGSGRRSLTRLAAHICGHKLIYPEIDDTDGYTDLRLALKEAVITAGVEERATVLLLGDTTLHHPPILHLLNTVILTGDIPNVLPPEDLSYLMDRLKLFAEDRGSNDGDLWKELIQRVADLVHIVITTPPSTSLTQILSQYPAFTTRLTVDYYKPWPQEALVKVGDHYLTEVPLRRSTKDSVIAAATTIHQKARKVNEEIISSGIWCPSVTPASYLQLLEEFRGLFTTRQAHTSNLKKKYLSGLDKLSFAASQISVMQDLLATLGPQIDEAARDVSRMMTLIEEESLEVEARRKLVQVEEEEAGVHAANARALKEECQAELNQALPALYEAIEALNTLKPADITVVKSMKNPPNAIKLVMAAVCVMLEVKPEKVKSNSVKITLDYWGPSKRLLGDLSFLQQLREYDKDNIAEGVMDKINREYVKLPEFDPVAVAKASSAAEGLCKWVRAMAAYDHINGIVAPKRERLVMAEEQLASRMAEVEAKRGELRELEDKLEILQRRFSVSCREKEKLENEQRICGLKLDRAQKLISGLGGEKERWEAAAQAASDDLLRLPGDTLMAAASLAYLAPYQPEIRDRLRDEWCNAMKESELEVSIPFNLVSFLTPALHIRAWGLEGLPTDGFSLQNATIIKHTVKWPLLVDPDELGSRWIQQHEAANGLEVVREQDMNMPSPKDSVGTVLEAALSHCVPRAIPLLLLDLSADPPSILQNVISRTTVEEGGVRVYRVGSLMLRFKPGFRLYLATRQPRPHLSLETAANLTVVNFTITVHGLHDNLRQILVTKERPELEDERQKLVATTSSHQRALQDTEERILQTLSSAQGDILESEEAIHILQETKQMSDEIKRKQEQCVETEEALLLCCQQYEKVSRPAADLYMTLTSLSTLSPMYQYSLSWYISLYTSVIDNTGKSSVLDRRLGLLQEALVMRVHSSVVMGLAASHRLVFTFLIALHSLRVSGTLKDQEEVMLQQVAANTTCNAPLPPPSLHSDLVNVWPSLYHLQMLDVFKGLSESLEQDEEIWLNLLSVGAPDKSALPQRWQHVEHIPWLILVAILRPDKVTWCVKLIIDEVLGEEFSSPPPPDLNRLLESPVLIKTGARTPAIARPPEPLLLVTSPGVDALEEVMLLASKNPEVPVKNVSLGQGQSSVAEEAVRLGVKEGGWIVLENLHHALGWLPFLANMINTISAGVNTSSRSASGALNPNFRLILTTEPVDEFPVSLLRAVEKVYVDNPGDAHLALKEANLALIRQAQSLYFDEEEFEPDDESTTYRLLHGLSIFHTIVSERGRHGHLAWASTPSFTMTDLSLAMNVVTCSIADGHMVDLELLEYLVSHVFYGGRVLSAEDQLVISSILKEIFAISFKIPEKEKGEGGSDSSHEDGSSDDKPTGEGEDNDEAGLSRLFPETIDRLDDLQEFVLVVTGLERPQVFGLPDGVQRVEEGERGRHFLNALAIVAGSQIRHRAKDKSMLTELKMLKKMLPRTIAGEEELFQCEDQEMADVLKREIQRYNNIVNIITNTTRAAIQTALGTCRYDGGGEELTSSLRLGHTPTSWVNLCPYPAHENLQHFLNDLHARVNFFRNWLENGCPTYFWLGAFQFLPAFFTTVLRQAARGSLRPLHHFSWSFHLTNMLCPQQAHLLPSVTLDSETSMSASVSKSVEEGVEEEEEAEATERTSEDTAGKDADGSSQTTIASTEEDEYGKPKLPLNLEESKQKWCQLGHEGLLVSGLWLVGASWNPDRNELDECTSQELIEKLPLLSMVPAAAVEVGPYTSRGLTSKSSTSRSHPSTHRQQQQPQHPTAFAEEEEETMESDSLPTERLSTRFTDEALRHLKDASLDLHLSEDLAITTRVDGPTTSRSKWYKCPVYEGAPGSTSRPPVLSVTLPAGPKGAQHWIQRRVAIYLSRC
ncbi:dynein axonemal heavy chain 3-like [Macrobrachium nipponense]|uniref:dynein axonemal heavy chain 3-like n=1 Tax=Macrobrachium nipponense TaxID=159736 RepID=UPI0030C8AE0F